MQSASSSAVPGTERSRAWWRRRRALAATFYCAYPATMEVGQTTSRSLASGHRPPGHALRGSGTDAHRPILLAPPWGRCDHRSWPARCSAQTVARGLWLGYVAE